jgi:cytochrome P450
MSVRGGEGESASEPRGDRTLQWQEEHVTDPHLEWRAGRASGPELIDGGRAVRVFTRADTEAVLRDEKTFSASISQASMGPFMGTVILGMDGEEHASHRRLVAPAFRAAALARWEDEVVRPTIVELIDRIAPRGRAELVRDVTGSYAARVIARIVGVPVEDHARFQAWAVEISAGPFDPEKGIEASEAMRAYLTPIVEHRRRHPGDDLISDIVTAQIDGRRLDDEHVYGFLRLLMPAGAETTYRALGIALFALLQHPDVMERVRADRRAIGPLVEETLRWDSPAPLASLVATKDTSVGGCPITAGTRVMLSMGSANRDEGVYRDPDDWDPDREDGEAHLAFGGGRHVCLGMHLARMELRVGLDAILDGLPNLRLDPDEPPPAMSGVAFRGPKSLPVRFDARR